MLGFFLGGFVLLGGIGLRPDEGRSQRKDQTKDSEEAVFFHRGWRSLVRGEARHESDAASFRKLIG
jgi:hypothetical protein